MNADAPTDPTREAAHWAALAASLEHWADSITERSRRAWAAVTVGQTGVHHGRAYTVTQLDADGAVITWADGTTQRLARPAIATEGTD